MQKEILLVAEAVSGEKGLPQEAIFQAITDRSDDVRQLARKSFWALAYHFPKAEQNILRRLSSPHQERLLAEKNNVFTIKEAKEMEQQTLYGSDNEMVQNAINAFDETLQI